MHNQTQTRLLTMLHALKAVLDAAHIEFFLIGGSAIGAVRDHGIIPWDDDIDVGIKRENIPAMIKAVRQSDLGATYKLIIPGETPGYYFPTYKLLLDLSGTAAPKDAGTGFQGVFIDIFALDKTYTSKWLRRLHQLTIRLDQISLDIAKGQQNAGQNLGKLAWIVKNRAKHATKEQLLAKYLRDIQRHDGLTRGFMYYNFGSPYAWDKESYRVLEVQKASLQSFEGVLYPVPVGYDKILTRTYGDYMKPPAKAAQHAKHLS